MLCRPRMRSPRLRIFDHCILLVNLMLRLEVVRVGGGPVAIQGRSDVVVFHLDLPSITLAIHFNELRTGPMPDLVIRPAVQDDLEVLWDFLAMAAYEPDGEAAKAVPPVAKHLVGWQRPGDFGFIAEQNGEIIGAAWARRFSAEELKFHYGDEETPKVSIGVKPNAVVRGYRVHSRAITATCSAKGCARKFLMARYSIEEQSRSFGSETP